MESSEKKFKTLHRTVTKLLLPLFPKTFCRWENFCGRQNPLLSVTYVILSGALRRVPDSFHCIIKKIICYTVDTGSYRYSTGRLLAYRMAMGTVTDGNYCYIAER